MPEPFRLPDNHPLVRDHLEQRRRIMGMPRPSRPRPSLTTLGCLTTFAGIGFDSPADRILAEVLELHATPPAPFLDLEP